ncbi:MAG: hypothetical protein H7329_09590 [Opitutaceae bacterium]|nr:hypothetical protein [Cytophagales bacterium]
MDKQSFEQLTSLHPDWILDNDDPEIHSFRDGNYIIKKESLTPPIAEHYIVDNVENHIELHLSESGKRYMVLDRSNDEYPVLELLRVDEKEHEQIHLIAKS